jgi:ABC-type phosphate/phosphonate transport system substrate-binding protein
MRNTDRDLTSVIIVRSDSSYEKAEDLADRAIGLGAVDSPQATLIPRSFLREVGVVAGENLTVRRFDVGVGLHGDHIGGERDAARALLAGEVDAAAVIDSNHLLFAREGTLPAGSTRVIAQTPAFDHCNMSVVDSAPQDLVDEFGRVLLSMSYTEPEVRPLFDLEGLTMWQEGRDTGYALLETAVDQEGFYSEHGQITASEYTP